jgi:hypothetical protein
VERITMKEPLVALDRWSRIKVCVPDKEEQTTIDARVFFVQDDDKKSVRQC